MNLRLFWVSFLALSCSCATAPSKPVRDKALVYGRVEVRLEEALEPYLLPVQTRLAGTRMTIRREDPRGKLDTQYTAVTDRQGWFVIGSLEAAEYRLLSLRSLGPTPDGPTGVQPPALAFSLWDRVISLDTDGVATLPDVEGSLPMARFSLEAQEQRCLGSLTLSLRQEAYPEEEGCLTRSLTLEGEGNALYLRDRPVGARLCVRPCPPEAAQALERLMK